MMMMIIALNSIVRQKEGVQGEGEEEVVYLRKGAKKELRRRAREFTQVVLVQTCWMQGTRENMDGGMGFHCTGWAEGARN